MRFVFWGFIATEVVLLRKLGKNEVAKNKPQIVTKYSADILQKLVTVHGFSNSELWKSLKFHF
jgi:hypothetical protein